MDLPEMEKLMPALHLKFSPDSSKLYFGHFTSCIYTLQLNNMDGEISFGENLLCDEKSDDCTIRDICTSSDGKCIAAIGQNSYIYKLNEAPVHIPRAATAFTAAAFDAVFSRVRTSV